MAIHNCWLNSFKSSFVPFHRHRSIDRSLALGLNDSSWQTTHDGDKPKSCVRDPLKVCTKNTQNHDPFAQRICCVVIRRATIATIDRAFGRSHTICAHPRCAHLDTAGIVCSQRSNCVAYTAEFLVRSDLVHHRVCAMCQRSRARSCATEPREPSQSENQFDSIVPPILHISLHTLRSFGR